jgi:hypothetical protein
VQVVGAADVVAGDHGHEGCGAVGAGGLEAAEGVAGERCAGAVAVAFGLDAGVDAGGVAAPELDVGVCDGLTTRGVDYVDVEVGDGTLLRVQEILSNELPGYPYMMLVHAHSDCCFCLQ